MKNLRKIATVCMFLFVVVSVINSVYGVGTDFSNALGNQGADPEVERFAQEIWGTISLVVQILAVAAVVFAGVRYMFASADAKADIKKQTVILIVGAVLVFGATFILQLVSNVTTNIVQ